MLTRLQLVNKLMKVIMISPMLIVKNFVWMIMLAWLLSTWVNA